MPRTAKTGASSGAARSKTRKASTKPSPEQRDQMIAEAAYYLAEQRGFQGGDPQNDWLQAEMTIDQMFQTRH